MLHDLFSFFKLIRKNLLSIFNVSFIFLRLKSCVFYYASEEKLIIISQKFVVDFTSVAIPFKTFVSIFLLVFFKQLFSVIMKKDEE